MIFSFFLPLVISAVLYPALPREETGVNGVLVLDLSESFGEKATSIPSPFSETRYNTRVYDVIRMIRYAKTDSAIKGIYIKAASNGNGLGTTEEIRNALLDFKKSKNLFMLLEM